MIENITNCFDEVGKHFYYFYNSRAFLQKKYLLLVCGVVCTLIFAVYISYFINNNTRSDFTKHTEVKVQLMQSGKMQSVVLKPINSLPKHTDFVGTSDKPTIDGGIINAADGMPVASFAVSNAILPINNINENHMQKNPVKSAGKITKSFQDDWATSSHVKSLLRRAAQEGKLDYVLNQIDGKGLPASLAIVPIVESNYQNNVVSKKGAAGAWQLMPATAKDYGINNKNRYKLKPSTEAALKFLRDLHKQFGSWELAFAAYNAGAERVQTALQKNPQATSVQELDLPQETKNYVSRIIALNRTIESL